ncbi:MAG TPA: S1C family serine protease [Acidimicrobiales bacterium]|nr:S1C family serine protease [Acidimicrobiales bacterium]
MVDVEVGGAGNGAVAAGTGMVVRSSGLVVTANHVIEGASAITVTDVGNGRTYRAAVAGYDRSRDVAVLRLRGASGLRTVRLGRAPGPTVGLGVVVVGGAGRAGGTPRYAGGAVTATGQAIPADRGSAPRAGWPSGLVATDVHVVPGDSGGAVVAADGDVVGMTDVTGADQIGAAGARGYAVPAVVVRSVVDAVLSGIAPPSVHLGPTAGLGAVARSAVLAMPAVGPIPGARITSLVAGGPGAAAGLETGDLITSVGGHAVTSAESLATSLLSFSPASTVLVGYVDASGLLQSVPVQLRPGPPQ